MGWERKHTSYRQKSMTDWNREGTPWHIVSCFPWHTWVTVQFPIHLVTPDDLLTTGTIRQYTTVSKFLFSIISDMCVSTVLENQVGCTILQGQGGRTVSHVLMHMLGRSSRLHECYEACCLWGYWLGCNVINSFLPSVRLKVLST